MDFKERYGYEFDSKEVKSRCVKWIRDWFDQNGKDCNAVVGISGGKDSTVVAALCVEALGVDRVIGVQMPNHIQQDFDIGANVIKHLGIQSFVINIGNAVNSIRHELANNMFDHTPSRQTMINLPPRIRMATLYAVSQSNNGRVANTCNLSEDWIGYSTRYGDSAGDFSPLAHLTSDEVIAIGLECGLPDEYVFKVPSDGLCGITDEECFGFSYEVLNRYIRTGVCGDAAIRKRIDSLHRNNLFKLEPMPAFKPMLGGETTEERVVNVLKLRGESVSFAESLTGGLVCSKLVSVPGASIVLDESYVTYSNAAKHRILGVSWRTLEKYSAVSAECAKEMAEGACEASGSDWGVATTGYAGPDDGGDGTPVGTVFIAISNRDRTIVKEYMIEGGRNIIREVTAVQAMDELLNAILDCEGE